MFDEIQIAIPLVPHSTNRLERMNWRQRHQHKKVMQEAAYYCAYGEYRTDAFNQLWPMAHVVFTLYLQALRDGDSLQFSCKPLLDVLKPMHPKTNPRGMGIIVEDDPAHVTLQYEQFQVPRAEVETVITVRKCKP